VLLHFVMLAGKVHVFDAQLRAQIEDPEVRTRLRRQLPSNIFVQFLAGPREVRNGIMGLLLWLIALISLVIGPVALLVFFQLQFLPYHDPWITWWQRISVLVDLALLWTLWPRVGPISMEKSEARRSGFVETTQRIGTIVVMLLISAVSVALVFAIATFRGEWLEDRLNSFRSIVLLREALVAGAVDSDARKPKSPWSNRLVVAGLDVIDHAKFDTEEKIAALPETASLRTRHLEGAVLIGAGLRKVDFRAAHLEGADLTSADLRGANLEKAHFEGAALDDAHLEGANLERAQLQGASLSGAHLLGSVLIEAHLEGAYLDRAELQGALLDSTKLQGASLQFAYLQGASLTFAHLQGAVLDDAHLEGAWLGKAELQVASLVRTFVWRADALSAIATDARIQSAETGPDDWSAASFKDLKQRIRQEVPKGNILSIILARVDPKLDPRIPLAAEKHFAERWDELQRSPPPVDYEAKLAELWRQIGCSTDGAPYVLNGLIEIAIISQSTKQLNEIAADFRKGECAGASGLSDNAKKTLETLVTKPSK
jgi:uncharacterized protein YjbI with pentapeptide repeats